MYYCYGQIRTSKGSVGAGSDQSKLWSVFTAGENPVQIIGGSYWSGDAGESYGLLMLAPTSVPGPNGTATLTGSMGAIALNFQMAGGNTQTTPLAIWPGQKTAGNTPPVVPPFWSLYVYPIDGTSTADFQVRLMGMDLVKP
jgi:hypothetical protein